MYKPVLVGEGRRFGAIGGVGLAEDDSHVVSHRPEADEQLLSNLPVGLAEGDEAQDFDLPVGPTGEISWGR